MYNPELAKFIGYHIGHVCVAIGYLILLGYLTRKKKYNTEFLTQHFLILLLFCAISKMMNYYFIVYLAGELVIIASLASIASKRLMKISEFLIKLSALMFLSNIIYYVIPIPIMYVICEVSKPNNLATVSLISLVILGLIFIPLFEKNIKRFIFTFIFAVTFSLLIAILYKLNTLNHLYYGLFLEIYAATVLLHIMKDQESSKITFISGLLLVADNFVGFLVYPAQAPISFIVYAILTPLISLGLGIYMLIKYNKNITYLL